MLKINQNIPNIASGNSSKIVNPKQEIPQNQVQNDSETSMSYLSAIGKNNAAGISFGRKKVSPETVAKKRYCIAKQKSNGIEDRIDNTAKKTDLKKGTLDYVLSKISSSSVSKITPSDIGATIEDFEGIEPEIKPYQEPGRNYLFHSDAYYEIYTIPTKDGGSRTLSILKDASGEYEKSYYTITNGKDEEINCIFNKNGILCHEIELTDDDGNIYQRPDTDGRILIFENDESCNGGVCFLDGSAQLLVDKYHFFFNEQGEIEYCKNMENKSQSPEDKREKFVYNNFIRRGFIDKDGKVLNYASLIKIARSKNATINERQVARDIVGY